MKLLRAETRRISIENLEGGPKVVEKEPEMVERDRVEG